MAGAHVSVTGFLLMIKGRYFLVLPAFHTTSYSKQQTLHMSRRNVLITGGLGGVGLTVTKDLMATGASVAILDVNEEAGASIIANLNAGQYTGEAYFFKADVTNWDNLIEAFDAALAALGSLQVVLPNAGVSSGPSTPLLFSGRVKPDFRCNNINFLGAVYLIQIAVSYFKTQPAPDNGIKGRICVTASQVALYPLPLDPLYGSSKHAVWGFVKGAAPVLAAEGIHINAVGPGFMNTPFIGSPTYAADMGFEWTPVETAARGILEVLDNDVWIGKLLECAGPVTALAKPQQYLDAYSQDVWEKTCWNQQLPWGSTGKTWNQGR